MPTPDSTPSARRDLWQYAGPFGLFIALQALPAVGRAAPFRLTAPEFWIYPLQTVLCAGVLLACRRAYPRSIGQAGGWWWGPLTGILVFILWISPQAVWHAAPRVEGGFDPHQIPPLFGAGENFYAAVVLLRFARLVLVVPALEEIFWRGFLLRYLVREDFTALPFGACSRFSFTVVTAGFMLEHNPPDWPAALAAGALYNLVAIRTRSLPACILAHAVTNLLLGIYIMRTGQWGFW